MRRSVLFPLMAVLTIVVLGLAVAEATIRILHPEATREAIRAKVENERNTWRRPDADFHHVGDGIFRLKIPAPAADPRARIMIVGDSFAMGHGVGEESRFGTLLQRSLGAAFEVDVLATSSYSPIVYRNIVRKALDLNRYESVAVFVDQTDPADDLIYRQDLLPGEGSRRFDVESMTERDALVESTYRGILEGLSGWSGLLRRSAAFNLLLPSSLLTRFPRESRHYPYVRMSLARGLLTRTFEEEPERKVTRAMGAVLFEHLDEIVELCRSREIPLLLAGNPWEYQVSAEPRVGRVYAGPFPRENRLEEVLVARYGKVPGVVVMELTRAFREHGDPSSLFLSQPAYEVHWNQAGHALVERSLRAVLQRDMLPGRTVPGQESNHGPASGRDRGA